MTTNKRKILAGKCMVLLIAFALLSAFVLHEIVPHEHAEEVFGTGVEAALHGQDRKWLMLLLLSALLWIFSDSLKRQNDLLLWGGLPRNSVFREFGFLKVFNAVFQALRRGIMHPKLCD
jgi:hypothetical protein